MIVNHTITAVRNTKRGRRKESRSSTFMANRLFFLALDRLERKFPLILPVPGNVLVGISLDNRCYDRCGNKPIKPIDLSLKAGMVYNLSIAM